MTSAGPPQPRRPRLTDINLIPRKEARPPISLFGVTVALLIVLLIYAVFPFAYLAEEYDWPDVPNLYGLWDEQRDEIDSLENTLDDAEAELTRLQSQFPEALALINQINELESLLSVMSGDYQILSQSAVIWSEVLEVIHDVAPAGVTITSITEGSSLDIEGTAVSGDDVTSFAMALSNTGLFGEVGPTDIEYEPAEDGAEPAEIVLDDGEDAWVGALATSPAPNIFEDCEDEWVGRYETEETIDNCDGAWQTATHVSYIPGADWKEGTGSVGLDIDAAFGTGWIAYNNISVNLVGTTHIEFWIKSSVDQDVGTLQLILYDDPIHASPLETFSVPTLTANIWTKVSATLTDPEALDTVASVGLSASADPGACFIWVDDIKAVIPWVTCSFDTTDKIVDSDFEPDNLASAKQVIYDAFPAPGLIAHTNLDAGPVNLNAYKQVTFWIKSSTDQSTGVLQLILYDFPNAVSTLETLDIPALAEDVWTSVTLTLVNPSALDDVESVGLYATADPGACTIWLDDVKAVTPGVICSIDILDFKEGEASAKMEIGAGFFNPAPFAPNVIAYEVLTSPKNLSSYQAITFWIKSNESTTFGDLQLLLDDNSGCETPWETINIPPLAKDIWTRVSLSFSDPEKLTAIVSIGLKATDDDVDGSIIWMDDVKVSELTGAGDYTFTITVSLIGGSQ